MRSNKEYEETKMMKKDGMFGRTSAQDWPHSAKKQTANHESIFKEETSWTSSCTYRSR